MNPLHTEDNLKQIVRYAKEVGPRNAALISRYTGIPATTVRYSLNNILKRRGIEFSVGVNYGLLGLRRHLLSLNFNPSLPTDPKDVLRMMTKGAFLEWYGRVIPTSEYFTLVALPAEFKVEYHRFLEGMVESGLLEAYDLHELDWFRLRSLDENNYDFRKARWDIDWSAPGGIPVHVEEPLGEVETSFRPDKVDLLVLKELQMDATQKLSEIAQKLDLTYRTVYYHYTEHVVGEGLINKYAVFPRMTYPYEEYEYIIHVLRDLREDELALAESLFHRLPFTWKDGFGAEESLYAVFTLLPASMVSRMLNQMSLEISKLRGRYSFYHISLEDSRFFTIPYEMMTEDATWTFEPQRILQDALKQALSQPVLPKK